MEVVALHVAAQAEQHSVTLRGEHLGEGRGVSGQGAGAVDGALPHRHGRGGRHAVLQDVRCGTVEETGQGRGGEHPGVAAGVGVALVSTVQHARHAVRSVLSVDGVSVKTRE